LLLQATRARATFFVAISSSVFIFKCREFEAFSRVFSFSRKKAQKGKAREGTNGAAILAFFFFIFLAETHFVIYLLKDHLF